MDKFYLFSKKVTHAVKVSMTLAIILLLFAYGQVAVGHESGYPPIGANAPNMLATNIDVGINQLTPAPKALAIPSGVAIPDVVYNGTTTYIIDLDVVLPGSDPEDVVKLTEITGTFALTDKNVGDGKTFTITSYVLEGGAADEYSLSTTSVKVDIDPMELEILGISVDPTKVYDGNDNATIVNSLAAHFGPTPDNVKLQRLGPKATFDNKNVGTGKTITISGFGMPIANEYNYIIKPSTLIYTANITQKPLTVSATCSGKQFDATTDATASLTDNRVAGDVLATAYSKASFEQEDVKINIPVSVEGISISGTDANNYSINETASTTANITPKELTISGIIAEDKPYDGNNKAILSGSALLVGVLGNDEVTVVNGTGTFADEEAGDNKDVTFTDYSIAGSDKANYSLKMQPSIVQADIEKKLLNITVEASDRDYDATTNASVTFADDRIAGDQLGIHSAPVNFADKNVGVDKPIMVSGIYIDGADANNYSNNATANTDASIAAIQLTISNAKVEDKKYDGQKTAVLDIDEAALVGNMIASDNVILNIVDAKGNFDTKDVGVGKTVTMDGFKINVPNEMNYILTQPLAKAAISTRHLSVDAEGVNKEYDGKTIAEVTLVPDTIDMVAGDALTFTYAADFTTKNMGVQTVNVKNIAIAGVNATNYALESTIAEVTAEITKKELSVIAVAKDKVYNGNDGAEVTLTPDQSDLAAGDVLTLAFTDANFTDKNVGDKTVNVKGITIKSGNVSGNYILEKLTATDDAKITPKNLTVQATVGNKVYNSATDVAVNKVSLASTDMIVGDNLVYAFNKATFSDENVGDRTVLVEGIAISGTNAVNYSLQNPTNTTNAQITPKDLTVKAVGGNKVYDGKLGAQVTFQTNDLVGDDVMDYDYTANFSDKNVDETGAVIPINVTAIKLKGVYAGNYNLTNAITNTTANITPRELTMTGITADDKLYNGNTVVVLHSDNAILVDMKNPELNLIALDKVALIKDLAVAEFADKMVGDAKPINVSGFTIVGDPNEYNYSLAKPLLTAKITPVPLKITGVTAKDKEYDGNTDAELVTSVAKLVGLLGTDIVTLESSASKGIFTDKNAIEYQYVTTSGFTLSGADKDNYVITTYPKTMASITPNKLTVTATGLSKTYDGLYNAEVKFGGWVAADNLSVTYTATFADDNANKDIPISVTNISIQGDPKGNYDLISTTANTKADITPRELKINGVTANNKEYDRTDLASLNLNDAVLDAAVVIAGDHVTLKKTAAVGTFENFDVDAGKDVSTTGFYIEGDDAVNYALVQPDTKADITPAKLTITGVTADNKIYDGTDVVNLNSVAVLNGVFSPDAVTLHDEDATANFDNKNVGDAKTVIVNGFTLEGADANNYSLTQPESVKANIAKRMLVISAVVDNKEYDGNTNAIISDGGLFMNNLLASDKGVTVFAQASFEDKDADENVTVNVTGIKVGGPDAGNYAYNTETTATADITPATLKITGVTANSRVYDGSTLATLSDPKIAQLSGVKSLSDDVKLVYYGITSNFTDKNVGIAKSVSTTGFDIEGIDVLNYNLEQPSPKANINPIVLNISGVTANNKSYDGTTTATLNVNSPALVGSILPNEIVTLITNGANGTFANKNVGTGKSVTFNSISLTGVDAGNYLLANTTTTATANITPKALAVTAAGVDKSYNATAMATAILTDNRVAGDILTTPYTAAFNDKNVGTGKAVTVSLLPITGADAANYALENMTASTTANITSVGLALTITGVTVNSKVYDGTTTATLNTTAAALSGVMSPDVVTLVSSSAAGTFANKNVGNGIAVTSTGFVLSGADAVNYTLVTPAMTSSITAKPLTITPNSISKCFGTLPTLVSTAFTPVGLVGSETVTGVTLTSNGTSASANVGTFDIVASNAVGTGLSNYLTNYAIGTMTVTPAQVAPVISVDPIFQVTLTSNATSGNQWYNAAGPITGATAQTYVATQNGSYHVMATGNCNTLSSNIVSVTHVSIPEFEKSAINVYPNPNQGEFWVNFKASGNEKLKMIQVYNSLGKSVYQATPSSVTNELTERVSIKNQPAGVYILVLTTDNQRISRQIVITK